MKLTSIANIIKPKQHIILLSHMRAYTSLIGHIFGNHKEIEGYYEMHTGYYSWKSSYKVKMMYYKEHQAKKGARFLFDKVLHDEHEVNLDLLSSKQYLPVISIRAPEQTIPSIVEHYLKTNPQHEFARLDVAEAYYINRIRTLSEVGRVLNQQFLYFNAEDIIKDTDITLEKISQYLQLTQALSAEYQKMEKTGARYAGDNSEQLMSGEIQKDVKQRKIEYTVPEQIKQQYEEIKQVLSHYSL